MTKPKQLRVTLEQVMAWEPCYTREQLVKLAGRRKTITALQILKLPIPDKDKLWAVLREELIPAKLLHRFACECAWSALMAKRKAGREPDKRSWDAVQTKRRWLAGKCSDSDLAAAESAAWSAAWSEWSAWSAAAAAAWSAESAAAAAWSAAWSAWSAAAARSARSARSAVWSKQIVMLIKMLSPETAIKELEAEVSRLKQVGRDFTPGLAASTYDE